MVAAGFGITVMPEFTHTNGLATIARPIIDPDLIRQLSLVTVPGRRHEQPAAWFLRAIRAQTWNANNSTTPLASRALMSFNALTSPADKDDPSLG